MFRRLALLAPLTGLTATALVVAPAPAHAFPDDTVPPQVSVTSGTPDGSNGWFRSPADVTIRASDRSGIDEAGSRVWLTGAETGDVGLVSGLAEHRVTAEGHTTIHWEISDAEGNTTTGSRTLSRDSGAPTAAVDGGGRYAAVGEDVPLRPGCDEAVSGLASCFLEGAVVGSGSATRLDTTRATEVLVTAVAVDNAGNTTRTDRTYSVVPADLRPTVTLRPDHFPPTTGWYLFPVTFQLTGGSTDPRVPVTSVAHQVGTGPTHRVEGTRTEFTVADQGVVPLRVTATDARGVEAVETLELKVDTVAPEVVLDVPTTVGVGDDVVVQSACTDATSGVLECRTNGSLGAVRLDTSRPGPVVVTGFAVDRAGRGHTVERTVQVQATALEPSTTTLRGPASVSSRQAPRVTITLGGWGATGGEVTIHDGARRLGRWTVPATVSRTTPDWAASLTVTLPRLAPGTHRLVARYAGNQHTQPSASRALVVVSRSPATVATRYGARAGRHQATVTVRGLDARPTGKVTVLDRGRAVGTGTLRDGRAVVRLARLARGTARLSVRYAGSATVQAATSRTTTLRVG